MGVIMLTVSEKMADEIRQWAQDELDAWSAGTAYHRDLADLLRQLDVGLPTAEDVRGIMGKR